MRISSENFVDLCGMFFKITSAIIRAICGKKSLPQISLMFAVFSFILLLR